LAEYNLASYVRDYDAETLYTDTEIGRVLDFLQTNGELDNTLVVVVADHGQGLYQHGHPSHGRQLYEEVVHIPWIMVWPARIPAGRVIKPPVSLLDVMPTIFEYLGVSLNHDEIHGRSLVSLVDGESEPDFEYRIYLQRQYQPPGPNRRPKGWQSERLFAVRSGQWKYIEGPDSGVRELYDLDVDPGETENLASKNRSTVEMLSGYLADWRREYATTGDEDDPAISPEVKEGLKALGYVD
jgi:arylsulfatase A-like enzyme